jgi:hypothetical protein
MTSGTGLKDFRPVKSRGSSGAETFDMQENYNPCGFWHDKRVDLSLPGQKRSLRQTAGRGEIPLLKVSLTLKQLLDELSGS